MSDTGEDRAARVRNWYKPGQHTLPELERYILNEFRSHARQAADTARREALKKLGREVLHEDCQSRPCTCGAERFYNLILAQLAEEGE